MKVLVLRSPQVAGQRAPAFLQVLVTAVLAPQQAEVAIVYYCQFCVSAEPRRFLGSHILQHRPL